MEYDSKTRLFFTEGVPPTAFTTSTSVPGGIIDTLGFESITFVLNVANYIAGDFFMSLEDGNDPGLSDSEEVLITDDPQTLVPADANNLKLTKIGFARIGYVGKKRYLRATIDTTNAPIDGKAYIVAILGHSKRVPTTEQSDA